MRQILITFSKVTVLDSVHQGFFMRKLSNYIILFFLIILSLLSAWQYFKPHSDDKKDLPQRKVLEISPTHPTVITTVITQKPTETTSPSRPPVRNLIKSTTQAITPTQTRTATIELKKLQTATLKIINSDTKTYKLEVKAGETLIELMQNAQNEKLLTFKTKNYSYGDFIYEINGTANNNSIYWFLYVNGKRTPVGASQQKVYADDIIEWKYED